MSRAAPAVVAAHGHCSIGSSSSHVFIRSKDSVWVPARLLHFEQGNDGAENAVAVVHVSDDQDDSKHTIQRVHLKDYPHRTLPLQNAAHVDDMMDLPALHEPGLWYNLHQRHALGIPYTRTARQTLLLAVNPYQWMPHWYTPERQDAYTHAASTASTRVSPPPPHVYEVSALAYQRLRLDPQNAWVNQSILVSGETGAGKTETVKLCLHHLARIGSANDSSEPSPEHVVNRIMESHPLLEAFGNAKTRRNDNSSRFGKYVQLCFHEKVLVGSHCDVYLLETSRVVSHAPGKRTYHVLYQLVAAPDQAKAEICSALVGTTFESFRYLGETESAAIEGRSDAEGFDQTVKALRTVGIEGDMSLMLFRCLVAVLRLGNLAFESHPNDSEQSILASSTDLELLAQTMGIDDSELLRQALTQRTLCARGETLTTPLTAEKAREACDALAKEVYGQTFLWLVRQINAATSAVTHHSAPASRPFGTIGLLDIFGFEAFDTNGFEQLCINYTNEMIQQKFTKDVFATITVEYESEGIAMEDMTYDDNRNVLDLIEGRTTGIMVMLNEESIRPNGNNVNFVRKIRSLHQGHCPCWMENPLFDDLEFGIRHYAGPVRYRAVDFVAKNADTIPSDLKDVAKRSSLEIIARFVGDDTPSQSPECEDSKPSCNRQRSSNIVGVTVWTKFKTQLHTLMERLDATEARYIRCIKPNSQKAPLIMETRMTVEQLRSAGVMAAVAISRLTFLHRYYHATVLSRYRSLWPMGIVRSVAVDDAERQKEDTETLLGIALKPLEVQNGNTTTKGYVVGHSRAYLRVGSLEYLEARRLEQLGFWAVTIQKLVRGVLIRCRVKRQRRAATTIAAHRRRLAQERRFARVRFHVMKVQFWYRRIVAELQAKQLRIDAAACVVQIHWRMHRDVSNLKRSRCATLCIQRHVRGRLRRSKFQKTLVASRRLQFWYRRIATDCQVRQMRLYIAACVIQVHWRMYQDVNDLKRKREANLCIQRHVRGWLQRSKFRMILDLSRQTANMAKQLKMMQQQMLKAEARWQKKFERERELARQRVEQVQLRIEDNERKSFEQEIDERKAVEQEIEELQKERDLLRLQNEAWRLQADSTIVATANAWPSTPSVKVVSSTSSLLQESIRIAQVVTEVVRDDPAISEEENRCIEESENKLREETLVDKSNHFSTIKAKDAVLAVPIGNRSVQARIKRAGFVRVCHCCR